jgi:hypothetical protein
MWRCIAKAIIYIKILGPVIRIYALLRTLKVYSKDVQRIHAVSRGWHCKIACKLNSKTTMVLKASCSWKMG